MGRSQHGCGGCCVGPDTGRSRCSMAELRVARGRTTGGRRGPSTSGRHVDLRPGGMPVLDATHAAALARNGVLLDARARPRYRGETEPVDPRTGHIPGETNAPFSKLTDAQGRWLPPNRLRELARRWGVADTKVGAYCGSGITPALWCSDLNSPGRRLLRGRRLCTPVRGRNGAPIRIVRWSPARSRGRPSFARYRSRRTVACTA